MKKIKFFVTASAVCFALAAAAFSEQKSGPPTKYIAGKYGLNQVCLQASAVYPATGCSINNAGPRCMVYVTDSWGNSAWVDGSGSPSPAMMCLFELRLP
jgi:hypothetical protein